MDRFQDLNMGRFSVDVELANYTDMGRAQAGDIPPEHVRRMTIRGVVDSGATRLVIPAFVAQQLGLEIDGQTGVRCADGRTAQRAVARGVHLTWGDRNDVFSAIVEPDRDSALIGAIVMGALDLLVDCTGRALRPHDPRWIISEIESSCFVNGT